MTHDTLKKIGVPDRWHHEILAAHNKSVLNAACVMSAHMQKNAVDQLAGEQRSAMGALFAALSPEMAARQAKCARVTVRRAIAAGEIKAIQGSTGLWLLDPESFKTWREARSPVAALATMATRTGDRAGKIRV